MRRLIAENYLNMAALRRLYGKYNAPTVIASLRIIGLQHMDSAMGVGPIVVIGVDTIERLV